jgi:NTE family protein
VREFTDLPEPPDELWVVQINPQGRRREPRSMREIKDRSNELSGNLSLGQELYFIDKINHLLQAHPSLGNRYKPIRIRVVQMDHEGLDYPSKLERRAFFIEALIQAGRERAAWFFDSRSDWPRQNTVPATGKVLPCNARQPVAALAELHPAQPRRAASKSELRVATRSRRVSKE